MAVHGWRVSFIPYYLISDMKWSAPKTGEAIRVLSRERFDGVEWMLGHHFNSPGELTSLVQRTRQRGLEVSNIMCWQDFVTGNRNKLARGINILCQYISFAGKLSVPVVNSFTGPMTWNPDHATVGRDISEGKAWSVVVDSFSTVAEAAEKNNVKVTLEAVFGMLVHDYYTLKEFLSRVRSKNMAVNVDPSHLVLYGNDPAWAVKMLGNKVRHVHVKDVVGKPGVLGKDFAFPFLGEGVIEWGPFFRALKSIGYSGFLSLEFENDHYLKNVCGGDWRIAARESKKRLMENLKDL